MLFQQRFWAGLADGTITIAFRRWARPRVLPGTRLRTAAGVLQIESVTVVDTITAEEARQAGYASLEELQAELDKYGDDPIHRIGLRHAGQDPRETLREQADLSADELAEVLARLARFDKASRHGPWTTAVLNVIAENPGVRAADLAEPLGRETARFKTDVRKLKELGLTESLGTGYRLSPRGRTVLDAL